MNTPNPLTTKGTKETILETLRVTSCPLWLMTYSPTFRFHGTSLQLDKQQHEDRPDSHGHRELNHSGVPNQATSR